MLGAIALGKQHLERMAEHVLGAATENLFRLEIEENDLLVLVDRDDAVFRDHQDARRLEMRILEG